MNLNIKKAFKQVKCTHCKILLNQAEKFMMPEEKMEWDCENCKSE